MSNWKAFADENTFTVNLGGHEFLCAKPSGAQLAARGIVPPALLLHQLDPRQAQMNGDRQRLLLDEKAQDALVDCVLIEPEIWDGPYKECPENQVPRKLLNKLKDVLVVAILAQLYDVDLVRGAAFRGGEGSSAGTGAGGEPVGGADDGAPAPARRPVRSRTRAVARG